jgi:hypothetical protein
LQINLAVPLQLQGVLIRGAQWMAPLVRAIGEEVGVRTAIVPDLQLAAASLWRVKLDAELLSIGNGESKGPRRTSRRSGV